ncbi:MAG: InlB B-repeat-containing protein, partial [Bacillota bacterium]
MSDENRIDKEEVVETEVSTPEVKAEPIVDSVSSPASAVAKKQFSLSQLSKNTKIIAISVIAVLLITAIVLMCVLLPASKSYDVTYTIDGVEYTVTAEKDAEVAITEPIKEGYSFSGWYTDENYENEWSLSSGASSSSDVAIFGKWELQTYTITYVLNGGVNADSNPSEYNVESNTITLITPTKEGYTFAGWSDNGTIASGSTGDKTFTATWAENNYSITYELDGGTNADTNPTLYGIESAEIVLASPTKEGYTFVG